MVKQLCREEELYQLHFSNDIPLDNGYSHFLSCSLFLFSISLLSLHLKQLTNFLLKQLLIEGGTAAAIFVRCFANKRSIELEIQRRFSAKFPRGVLATICVWFFACFLHYISLSFISCSSFNVQFHQLFIFQCIFLQVILFFMTSYCAAALGQLFLFHIVLIRKVWLSPFFPMIWCSATVKSITNLLDLILWIESRNSITNKKFWFLLNSKLKGNLVTYVQNNFSLRVLCEIPTCFFLFLSTNVR